MVMVARVQTNGYESQGGGGGGVERRGTRTTDDLQSQATKAQRVCSRAENSAVQNRSSSIIHLQ